MCARHLGDNYSKNALSVYTGIVGSSCDLAMLCNVAVFLSVALLQSIIFPIEAFLTNLTAIDAGALGDSPAISIASAKGLIWSVLSNPWLIMFFTTYLLM